jgi:hypothetical protein
MLPRWTAKLVSQIVVLGICIAFLATALWRTRRHAPTCVQEDCERFGAISMGELAKTTKNPFTACAATSAAAGYSVVCDLDDNMASDAQIKSKCDATYAAAQLIETQKGVSATGAVAENLHKAMAGAPVIVPGGDDDSIGEAQLTRIEGNLASLRAKVAALEAGQ